MRVPPRLNRDDKIRLDLYEDPKPVLRVIRRVGIFDSAIKLGKPDISVSMIYTFQCYEAST